MCLKGGMVLKLKEVREKAGVSQEKLAAELGYKHQSTISMIENGERKIPSDKIPLLAKVLGCSIEELYGEESKREEG